MNLMTVYVQLLNEGTPTYRPTQAEEVGEGIYRLLPTDNYDPEDEEWEFLPGALVRCVLEMRSGANGSHEVLAAREGQF